LHSFEYATAAAEATQTIVAASNKMDNCTCAFMATEVVLSRALIMPARKLTGSKIFCCCWGGRVEYKGNILMGPTCSHKEEKDNLRTDHTKITKS